MFEKEAEEYADEKCGTIETEEKKFCRMDWQKGAEFGYNKAKEEMQKQGLALQSDMDKTIEQNIQLKKQNNWLEGCKLELAEHLGKANDRISELEQQIEELKKIEEEYYDFIQKKNEEDWKGDNVVGCLKLKIEQLKALIEKMKCCENCAKNGHICVAEEMQGKLCGKNKVKWQLRR